MEGGTTFHFVTDGIESAIEQARAAAGEQDVLVAGGGTVIAQAIAAGLVDELQVHVAPVFLGGGARLFDGMPADVGLEIARVVDSPTVTHLRYRVTALGRAILGAARGAEAHDLVRAVAERPQAGLAAAAEGDGAAVDLDLLAVLVDEAERAAHEQRPVAVGGDRRLVHATSLPAPAPAHAPDPSRIGV